MRCFDASARGACLRVSLLVIVALALGLRLSYLASDPHNPKNLSYYGEVAQSLITGHGFSYREGSPFYIEGLRNRTHRLPEPAQLNLASTPGLGQWRPWIDEPVGGPLLLAGLWEVADRGHYLPLQILQAFVDALCVLLVFSISLRLFKRPRAALAAAALYAVYPPIAWQTTIVYNDIWSVDFTLAIVAAYLQAIGSVDAAGWARSRRWLVVCGLLTGAGLYFRPNLVILPGVLALVTIAVVGWRRTLVRVLVPTAIALVLVAPWLIRDYRAFHTFVFVRSGLGITMWSGLGETQNDFGASQRSYSGIDAKVRRLRPDLRPETPAFDSFLLDRFVIPAIESHPLYYAELVGRRIFRSTLLLYEGGTWQHRGATFPGLYRRTPGSLASFFATHPLAVLENIVQPLAFLSAMLAMALTWGRWRRQHILLLAVMLSGLVPYIIVHFEPRYTLPAASVYVVWIGLGLDLLGDRIQQALRIRRTRPLADPSV
jgi:4-amino-4-deoxy-L-arabinose transferase-like glycosyltransferase